MGASLVALDEDPEVDETAPSRWLDRQADRLGQRSGEELFLSVARINHLLFQELGFEGDTQVYDDPRNSLIHRVIERRRGMPILMSLVYLELARRVGVELDGIGFPGHFVVSPTAGEPRFFIDPFHGGRILKEPDMRGLLRRFSGAWEVEPDTWERFLAPVTSIAILVRINNNLKRSWSRRRELDGALRASERNLVLEPHSIAEHHDRAVILDQMGRRIQAIADLEAYLSVAPDDADPSPLYLLLERLRQR